MNGFSFDAGSPPVVAGGRGATGVGGRRSPRPCRGSAPMPAPGRRSALPVSRVTRSTVPTGAAAVRPYAWTRGRTRPGYDLAIETLVSTSQRGRDQVASLQLEHRAVAELCEQTSSVAEVAALLSVPLGVATRLLGRHGRARHGDRAPDRKSSNGDVPDLALMERVLSGLRRL